MFIKPSRPSETITKFRNLFENEKQRLLLSSRLIGEQFAVQKDEMMDEVDFTSFELENQMQLRLKSREALYLKKIDEALERIAEGTFGQCEECEEEIELKRLEARPTTTLCLGCKELAEKSEKLHIDGHRHKSLGSTKIRLA